MPTTLALVLSAPAIFDHAEVLSHATVLTREAIGPASTLQCRISLLLSPKGPKEIGKEKSLLVLNFALKHPTVLRLPMAHQYYRS
jgi:hypothetical protein